MPLPPSLPFPGGPGGGPPFAPAGGAPEADDGSVVPPSLAGGGAFPRGGGLA